MNLRLPVSVSFLVIFAFSVSAQKLKKADKLTLTNLEDEIHYLADDKLEGRRTARMVKSSQAILSALPFKNRDSHLRRQSRLAPGFPVDDGKQIAAGTLFSVNNTDLVLEQDYFPLPYSAVADTHGSVAIALLESGAPWFVDLKELLESRQGNPHFDLGDAIYNKANDCSKKGATAVIFFNSTKMDDELVFDAKNKQAPLSVPVLYVTKDARKKIF